MTEVLGAARQPNAARALVKGEPLVGYWFNRTKEWNARRRGEDFQKYDYATRYARFRRSSRSLRGDPRFVNLAREIGAPGPGSDVVMSIVELVEDLLRPGPPPNVPVEPAQ